MISLFSIPRILVHVIKDVAGDSGIIFSSTIKSIYQASLIQRWLIKPLIHCHDINSAIFQVSL